MRRKERKRQEKGESIWVFFKDKCFGALWPPLCSSIKKGWLGFLSCFNFILRRFFFFFSLVIYNHLLQIWSLRGSFDLYKMLGALFFRFDGRYLQFNRWQVIVLLSKWHFYVGSDLSIRRFDLFEIYRFDVDLISLWFIDLSDLFCVWTIYPT